MALANHSAFGFNRCVSTPGKFCNLPTNKALVRHASISREVSDRRLSLTFSFRLLSYHCQRIRSRQHHDYSGLDLTAVHPLSIRFSCCCNFKRQTQGARIPYFPASNCNVYWIYHLGGNRQQNCSLHCCLPIYQWRVRIKCTDF